MKVAVHDTYGLAGALPEATIRLEYAHHASVVLEMTDDAGEPLDLGAMGMVQWKAAIAPSSKSTEWLDAWVIEVDGDKANLELGLYSSALFNFIAGREEVAAVLQLAGYSTAYDPSSMERLIEIPVMLTVSSDIRTPVDLHTTLLEELSYAVTAAARDAARAEAVKAALPDIENVSAAVAEAVMNSVRAELTELKEAAGSYAATAEESRSRAAESEASAIVAKAAAEGALASFRNCLEVMYGIPADEDITPMSLAGRPLAADAPNDGRLYARRNGEWVPLGG